MLLRLQTAYRSRAGPPLNDLITHCGSEIVTGDERSILAEVRRMADERGVEAELAHDGMMLVVR